MKNLFIFISGFILCLLVFFAYGQFSQITNNRIAKDLVGEDISKLSRLSLGNNEIIATDKTDEIYIEKILVNGEEVVSNDHTGLLKAYPSQEKPEIVIAWADCGGSACGRAGTVLVDLKAAPPFYTYIDEVYAGSVQIKSLKDNIFLIKGSANHITNEYGDLIDIEIAYNRQQREVTFISRYSHLYVDVIGVHPNSFLGNKKARQIFLDNMTPEQFRDFRYAMSVSGKVSLINNGRTIVSSGMAPHSGGNPSSFFIIDVLTNTFIVGYYEDGQYTFYSDKNLSHIPYDDASLINEFLADKGFVWDYDTDSAKIDTRKINQFR